MGTGSGRPATHSSEPDGGPPGPANRNSGGEPPVILAVNPGSPPSSRPTVWRPREPSPKSCPETPLTAFPDGDRPRPEVQCSGRLRTHPSPPTRPELAADRPATVATFIRHPGRPSRHAGHTPGAGTDDRRLTPASTRRAPSSSPPRSGTGASRAVNRRCGEAVARMGGGLQLGGTLPHPSRLNPPTRLALRAHHTTCWKPPTVREASTSPASWVRQHV